MTGKGPPSAKPPAPGDEAPPVVNLGRQWFNVASWPLYPFGNRPQQLPPLSLASYLGMMSGVTLSPLFLEMLERTEQQPTAMTGGTARLERDGVAVELYLPSDADRATLAAALPGCDLDNPPWHAVQARLVAADLSADWANLTAPAAVALLARAATPPAETSTPPAAIRTPGTRQDERTGTGIQGEGKAGTSGAVGQQAAMDVSAGLTPEQRKAIFDQVEPAVRKAYVAFTLAESKAERRLEDREAWTLLDDEGIPTDKGDLGELADYSLPSYLTFTRQCSEARRLLQENKYNRRAGRPTGKSVVRGCEVEYRRDDE